jgi:hypothetical protein
MIQELKSISRLEQSWAGKHALNLFSLHTQGITVIDTVVISNRLFEAFLQTETVSDEHLSRLGGLLRQDAFTGRNGFYLSCSLPTEYTGLKDGFRVQAEPTDLKFWIEKVFRSWSEDKARYSRITRGIEGEESWPAILIQPFLDNLASLCTRAPKSGDFTDCDNWEMNIHNSVEMYLPTFTQWLECIEDAIGEPCKVYFENVENTQVCAISDQVMSNTSSRFGLECAIGFPT